MPPWLWLALLVAGACVVHRLLLAAEARGWVYYLHRRSSPGTAATALLEVHALLEPEHAHVREQISEAALAREVDREAGHDRGDKS